MREFRWPVRVYYEDTDSGGVVYYANYLKFMERARSEWLRSLGVEQDILAATEGIIFAVRSVQVEYLKPARFNDALCVSVAIEQCGRASLTFEQQVTRVAAGAQVEKGDDTEPLLYCSGRVKVACLDYATLRPRPIPAYICAKLLPYMDVREQPAGDIS